MSLRDDMLTQASGDRYKAAAILAQGLQEGDPASFKAGYTRENAILAAAEFFNVSADSVEEEMNAP